MKSIFIKINTYIDLAPYTYILKYENDKFHIHQTLRSDWLHLSHTRTGRLHPSKATDVSLQLPQNISPHFLQWC